MTGSLCLREESNGGENGGGEAYKDCEADFS